MGYNIDAVTKVKIQKFEFFDKYDSFYVNSESWFGVSVEEILDAVTCLLTALDSSTIKGFLPQHDLSLFPVVSEILPSFCSMDKNCVNGEFSMECYKWIYNLVQLNMYMLIVECLGRETELDEDVECNLKALENAVLSRLDPSIRQ